VGPCPLAAAWLLAGGSPILWENVVRFFTQDIVPAPLRSGESVTALGSWAWDLFTAQAIPGIINTVILTQIALVATGIVALCFFPLISSKFFGWFGRSTGHLFLVIIRSTPEYVLAFIFLQLWGPSMLPAVVALALHNGAIIGHLIGRYTNELPLRPDAPTGINLYSYEIVPTVYGQFLAFLFYRWEIIMRETAILGILGIASLGFYVDSAIQDIRMDRAMFLILITALLNIGVDVLSRTIRARLRLKTTPECG
jgi:phosphonate transport system permease protein